MEEFHPLTGGQIAIRIAIFLVLVLANAFFVAAEFALVSVSRPRIETLAETRGRSARLLRGQLDRLDHFLSSCQLGITLASLGIGAAGEQTLAAVLIQVFRGLPEPWNVIATHSVALTIALFIATALHIVIGEQAPKALGLVRAEATALWIALPLSLFTKIFTPAITVLNAAANGLLKSMGLPPPSESQHVHRPEELRLLVAQSHESGELSDAPAGMIAGALNILDTTVGEVMTPRTDVVAVQEMATVRDVSELMLQHGHFRIPVYRRTTDQMVGVVLARDAWRAERTGQSSLGPLIRPIQFVPDSKRVQDLLREMQRAKLHMAIVVDEYGGTAGIVTMEDLVEEVVGEIQDEHEEESPDIVETPEGEILVDGMAPLSELNERFDLDLPEEEHNTVAGYTMARLGRIATEEDEVTFAGGRLRVLRMNGRRIERVAIDLGNRPQPPAAGARSEVSTPAAPAEQTDPGRESGSDPGREPSPRRAAD